TTGRSAAGRGATGRSAAGRGFGVGAVRCRSAVLRRGHGCPLEPRLRLRRRARLPSRYPRLLPRGSAARGSTRATPAGSAAGERVRVVVLVFDVVLTPAAAGERQDHPER